jgi:hypothetical protein
MGNLVILSLCEVHRAQAIDWADRRDMNALWLFPRELQRDLDVDAVVCDWDFWPHQERQQMLTWFEGLARDIPVIVKAYHVAPEDAFRLDRCGAALHAGWGPELFEHVKTPVSSTPNRSRLRRQTFQAAQGRIAPSKPEAVSPEELFSTLDAYAFPEDGPVLVPDSEASQG